MRIGIWCDYGVTLGPSEGIGVFVDNLARGLVRADRKCRVVMMARAGQSHVLASTVAGGEGRVEVVSGPSQSRFRRWGIRTLKKIRNLLRSLAPNHYFAHRIDASLGRWVETLGISAEKKVSEIIQSCDVWLLPYVGLEQEFCKPTIVVIHDLVSYHFPEMMPPAKLESLKRTVNRVSSQATIAACMSEFIRDHDLIGTLGLPPNRIRVIKAAVPDDLGVTTNASAKFSDETSQRWLALNGISCPYLFYPAAFRIYKNHRFLVDALHLLTQKSDTQWKIVFTGIHKCPLDLRDQIDALKLSDRVVVLRKVSRAELERLYRHAFATIVPSLYEQGSFPVMEALACRCPVAASDIPALREQFRALGSSMLYFDPKDPSTLIGPIEFIQKNRNGLIASQSEGFERLRERTWEMSGREWHKVFCEAIGLGCPIAEAAEYRSAV